MKSKLILNISNELNQIKSDSNENLTIQRLGNIINKMNFIINILLMLIKRMIN